ncbi:MAG: hypothetical protein WCR42_06510 [bacterium]
MLEKDDVSIMSLYDSSLLSIRAYHVCYHNSLLSLKSIFIYRHNNPDFMKLKKCGDKTNNELLKLCKKNNYSKFHKQNFREKPVEDIDMITVINSLTPFQRARLENILANLISQLGLRARNQIMQQKASIDSEMIFKMIFSDNFKFKNMIGVGVYINNELNTFKSKLISFIKKIQTIKNEDFDKEFCEFTLKMAYPLLENDFNELFEQMYEENGQLKIFALLKFLIDRNQIFTERELLIFSELYTTNFKGKRFDQSIVTEHSVSKERLRQIKKNIENNLSSFLNIIRNLQEAKISNYGIVYTNPFQIIDDNLSSIINKNEKTNFNSRFCCFVFNEIYSKTLSFFNKNELHFPRNYNGNRNIYSINYLLSSAINSSFYFSAFMNDILLRTCSTVWNTYQLDFEDHIKTFIIKGANPNISDLIYICKGLLKTELNFEANSDGYLVFNRTTRKNLYEYCYDILNKEGTKMSLANLCNTLEEEYPEIEWNKPSLRSKLNTQPQIFISFGRSSVYGLKKWEEEQSGIKGGSIRSMIYEYLKNDDEPKHITEILQYVLNYRPNTNAKNIRGSLVIDKSNRFLILHGGFIGIRGKRYNPKSTKTLNVNGSHFTEKYLNRYNGWELDDILKYYQDNFHYRPIQIRHILERKIIEGILIVKK